MKDFNVNTDIQVGTGVTYSINGDSYPYYVVDWTTNKKGVVTEVMLTDAESTCNDWYANDWTVKPFDPNAENPVTRVIRKTRNGTYTSSGLVEKYGGYHFGGAWASRDPSF